MNKYLFCLFFLFLVNLGFGQPTTDQSQSPYFLVTSDGTQVESFPLLSTVAEVNIAGVIADVTVRQTYKNDGEQPIEALYVFPASTRAAVYGMQMKVGGRVIIAEIKEKQAARREYEAAKQEGRRASLLEQERPNVFQMSVANIMPGDQVEVELYYTELLIPEQNSYQFVFPTVVGPRFVGGNEQQSTSFAAMPYTSSDKSSPYEFDMTVYVNGGMPLQDVGSSSHQVEVRAAGKSSVEVKLAPEEASGGNKDFILDFSFAGDQIESGLLLYNDGEEKFFLCMAQAPKQVAPEQVPDREYIFVMDVSGSMNGFPLEVSKQLMTNLVNQLKPTDRFNVLFFAGASNLWMPQSQTASPENLSAALDFMQNVRGGGGTRLLPALQKAMNLERQSEALSRSILIITDGYVGVENETFELIRTNLNKTNVFSFGIGSSVNRHLIEGMAHAGQGLPFIVTDKSEAFKQAQKLRSYIQNPVMTQIEARFPGLDVYDVEPKTIPDVLSERPVILFGKYRGKAKGEIYLEGTSMQLPKPAIPAFNYFAKGKPAKPKRVKLNFPLASAEEDPRNKALKYLWARERIRNTVDFKAYGFSDADKQEVIRLGLKYNLLTPYTSFIAVEKRIANQHVDSLQQVKQPLPLPEGMSDEALGFHLSIQGMSNIKSMGLPILDYALWIVLAALILGIILWYILKTKTRKGTLPIVAFLAILGSSCQSNNWVQQENPYQEVTFILGEDASAKNPYYHNAAGYFSSDDQESTALLINNLRSLTEVRNWLQHNAPSKGAWEKINLVAHGNQWTGINVPVSPQGERCTSDKLQQMLQSNTLQPFSDQIINHQTLITVFGCNVGLDARFLSSVREFFSSNTHLPQISSAPYFNIFKNHQDSFSRHLAEAYFVAFPAGSFPGNKKLAQQLAEKYPDQAIDWSKALLQLEPNNEKAPYVHYFHIPVEWGYAYKRQKDMNALPQAQDTLHWIEQLGDLQLKLADMDLEFSHFRWEIREDVYKKRPVRIAFGQTIIYCILKPITDSKKQYLSTDPRDPAYYTIID